MGADGKLVSSPRLTSSSNGAAWFSLMPEGLQAGLSLQEFTDLTEYLVTLKQPETALVSNRGMPGLIPEVARPVTALRSSCRNSACPGPGSNRTDRVPSGPGLTNVFSWCFTKKA